MSHGNSFIGKYSRIPRFFHRFRRFNIDNNYAKYGKASVNKIDQFVYLGAIGMAVVVIGFTLTHFARFDGSHPSKQLKNHLRQMVPSSHIDRIYPTSINFSSWNVSPIISHRRYQSVQQNGAPKKNVAVDYGGLTLLSLQNEKMFARRISEDSLNAFDPNSIEPNKDMRETRTPRRYPQNLSNGSELLIESASSAEFADYYDDYSVNLPSQADDGTASVPSACQEPEFKFLYKPTCNDFHERDWSRAYDDPGTVSNPRSENEVNIEHLGAGFYRDTWILEDSPWIDASRFKTEKLIMTQLLQQTTHLDVLNVERTAGMIAKAYRSAVVKTPRMAHKISPEFIEEVWTEAIIMERLTKSPRIISIYGHCSTTTMVEVVPIEFEEAVVHDEGYESHETIEERNKDGVRPYNNFTATEKLHFALDMAESIADLHGFEDGVIIHDDIQMCQWLRTPSGRLKLGDFNRGTIMSWDLFTGEYCKFNNGAAFSQYRSPEEYAQRNLNEQIDTFSFGNNIYAMITGLWNWVGYLILTYISHQC
jgi:hypothetical protein